MKFLKFFRLFVLIIQMISTGLQKLDEFLSGGIPSGVIVDIFGGAGTGKTQLLLQLSINSIKKADMSYILTQLVNSDQNEYLKFKNKLKHN